MILNEQTVQQAKELASEMVRLENERKRKEQREALINIGNAIGNAFNAVEQTVTDIANSLSVGIKEAFRKES